jgi:hypothetical protein
MFKNIDVNGNFHYVNSDKVTIFQHIEYSSFDPYDDLQPVVIMEQINTDGALDKVAVRYEGSKKQYQ